MAGRRIVIQIKVEGASKTTRDLDQINKRANKFTQTQNRLNQSFTVAVVKARLISAAYTNIKRAIDFGIKGAIDFEFAMKKVQAITATTGKDLDSLEKTVRDLASVSPRTATEVANTALAMAKLGLTSKEVEDALEGVIGLSVALDENVESVGQTLVAVKNVFQKEAKDLTQISDQLFTAFANSALNLDKFSTAFSFAGGAAKLAGVEVEELAALMGVLADAGIRASTIGTQLRSIFLEMSNSTSKFGKATGGVTIKKQGLVAALKAAKVATQDEGEAYRIFGKRAVSVVDVLTRSIDKFEGLRDTIESSEGATKKASATLSESMAVALKETSSAWTDLNIELSKFWKPTLIVFLDAVAASFRGIKNAIASASKASGDFGVWLDKKLGGGQAARGKRLEKQAVNMAAVREAGKLRQRIGQRANAAIGLGELGSFLGGSVNITAEAEKDYKDYVEKTKRKAIEAEAALLKLNQAFGDLKQKVDLANVGLEPLNMTMKKVAQEFRKLAEGFLDAGQMDKALEAAGLATGIENELDKAAKRAAEKRDKEKEAAKDFEDYLTEVRRMGVEDRKKADEKALKLTEKRSKEREELNRRIREESFNGAANLTSALANLSQVQADNELKAAEKRGATEEELDKIRRKAFEKQKRFSLLSAIINTAQAVTSGLATKPFIPLGLISAGLAGAAGAVQIAAIGAQQYASGFDGMVNRPTPIIAGEAGPERVQITPAAKSGKDKAVAGLTVIIQGDVYGEEKFTMAVNKAMQNIDRNFVGV